jgi:hypothetical protein
MLCSAQLRSNGDCDSRRQVCRSQRARCRGGYSASLRSQACLGDRENDREFEDQLGLERSLNISIAKRKDEVNGMAWRVNNELEVVPAMSQFFAAAKLVLHVALSKEA